MSALFALVLATYVEAEKKPRRELEPLPGASAAEVEEAPSHKYVTIAWQPLQLLFPIVSMSVEARIAPRFSIAASGGYGTTQVFVAVDKKERRTVAQWGALFSYYVAGDFDTGGVHVGAAAQWTRVAGSEQVASGIRPGLLVGPLIGFKWVVPNGFTLDSQIGIGVVAAETSGSKPNDPDQKTALLGNVGVGWTF
jgi:hypothetical protein